MKMKLLFVLDKVPAQLGRTRDLQRGQNVESLAKAKMFHRWCRDTRQNNTQHIYTVLYILSSHLSPLLKISNKFTNKVRSSNITSVDILCIIIILIKIFLP
jgi:hypothetical protein